MTIETAASRVPLPDLWQSRVTSRLESNESVIAWVSIDLDSTLNYRDGLLVLTAQRVLHFSPDGGDESWALDVRQRLNHFDHAGVGTIELNTPEARIAFWRHTLGQNVAALRLIKCFERIVDEMRTGVAPELEDERVCSTCHNDIPDDAEDCPICNSEILAPPSTWTLLRLWRFTKPYKWMLYSGFALMLMSTALTLVTPYLSKPLMDDVLIPFQNGAHIEPGRVFTQHGR